LKKIHKKQLKL